MKHLTFQIHRFSKMFSSNPKNKMEALIKNLQSTGVISNDKVAKSMMQVDRVEFCDDPSLAYLDS
jgi:hypothetical protein